MILCQTSDKDRLRIGKDLGKKVMKNEAVAWKRIR